MATAIEPKLISFVIPAYNEEALLGETIRSIQRAMEEVGVESEIVVANDDSSDNTAGVAHDCGARVVDVANRQIAATRNAGARAATGDLLIFVDADSLVSGAMLVETLAAIREGAVGGGATIRFCNKVPIYAQVLIWVAARLYRLACIGSGAFLFCTREAFEATGGFDETLYAAEEAHMSKALRGQGSFVVLREPILTSGRKLRMYSAWQLFRTIAYLALHGGKLTNRDQGKLWYDGLREGDSDGKGGSQGLSRPM